MRNVIYLCGIILLAATNIERADAADFYAKGLIGAAFVSDLESRIGDVGIARAAVCPNQFNRVARSFNSSFAGGIAVGAEVAPRVSAELSYVYERASGRVNAFSEEPPVPGCSPSPQEVSANNTAPVHFGMANVVFDIPTGQGFSAFIGAGGGVAHVVDTFVTSQFDNQTVHALQFLGGIEIPLTANLSGGVQYAYRRTGKLSFERGSSSAFVFERGGRYQSSSAMALIRIEF